ncbi:MAG: universal stress protein [Myxococcales bacterium]|nr:universal stress protein [Myxococcales bacterium]
MSERLKKIVVGYDFSEPSTQAVRVAVDFAKRFGATLSVVTAIPGHLTSELRIALEPRGPVYHEIPFDYENRLQENVHHEIRKKLAEIDTEGVDLRVEVPIELKPTKPFVSLLDLANFVETDLIVVGATGMGRLRKWLVGSTAERLVRKSRFPVYVVKSDQPIELRRVLCPVDFSDASRSALEFGATFARAYRANLDILHVMEPVVSPQVGALVGLGRLSQAEGATLKAEAETNAEAKFERLVAEVDLSGIKWQRQFSEGLAEYVIVDHVTDNSYDLVSMGSLGRGFLRGMLIGNTAEKVLRSLPASLLTVKPDDFVLKHRFFRRVR